MGGDEDRTVDTVMSCLLAAEAKTFFNANLLFLWSELPDTYGIYVHSVWVLGLPSGGGGEVKVYERRGGFVVFDSSRYNLIGLIPLGLEPFCLGIPFVDGSGYRVHRVDMAHECWIESFGKEGDEDSLVDYPIEVGSNLKFVDIGEYLVSGLCDELEVSEGFYLEVSGKEGFGEGVLEVGKGSKLLVVNGI